MRRLGGVGRMVAVVAALLLAGTGLSACRGGSVELKTALQPTDIVTGWFDVGIVKGQNKLVPTISFRLKNVSGRAISNVDLNAVFRVVDDPQALGSKYVKGIGRDPLAPGALAGPFVLRSELGYASEGSRLQMLQNSQFRDAQVEVFAKHASSQWVQLRKEIIQRQLLTQ
jgi:hypothetical protein